MVRRREAGWPLEHVVGWVDFGGHRLSVGRAVFVPRQRSLFLAGLAVRSARRRRAPVLLEAYAGVAPLAATAAAALPGLEVHTTDVDAAALRHARRNLPPGSGVHRGEVLDGLPPSLASRVTLLVAVPPYVPLAAAAQLPHEARVHEPARALFGGADGLDPLRALLRAAPPWLAPGAQVLVELHRDQQDAAAAHAERSGYRAARHDADDGQTTVLALTRSP